MSPRNLRLAAPWHWPSWALVGAAWLSCRLPLRWQFALGRRLGRLAFQAGGRRRAITETNIAMCFPELDAAARAAMARSTFEGVGIGLLEAAYAWSRPAARLAGRIEIHGLSALREAQAEGRGVLLAGMHFATLDIAGALLAEQVDFDVIYRHNRNAVIDWAMRRGRERRYQAVIERSDMRRVARHLKQGHIVWYAADQDFGRRHSIFAPFFGHPAATITAGARLARMHGSAVVLMSHFRDEARQTWSLRLRRLPDYPSGDDAADAARMNQAIEAEIRRRPDQYLWLHRRFKTHPEGKALYGRAQRRRKRRPNAGAG